MAEVIIQFSTAAAEEWFDRWIVHRSLLICRLSHAPFSHSDTVVPLAPGVPITAPDQYNLLGSSDSPKAPVCTSDSNPRGVAVRPHNYQKFMVRRWARVPCSQQQYDAFMSFAHSQVGKPFDKTAVTMRNYLSASFANRNWRDNDAWFCHELTLRCLEVSKIIWWKMVNVKDRITSTDVLNLISPMIDADQFVAHVPGMIMDEGEK